MRNRNEQESGNGIFEARRNSQSGGLFTESVYFHPCAPDRAKSDIWSRNFRVKAGAQDFPGRQQCCRVTCLKLGWLQARLSELYLNETEGRPSVACSLVGGKPKAVPFQRKPESDELEVLLLVDGLIQRWSHLLAGPCKKRCKFARQRQLKVSMRFDMHQNPLKQSY